jgi:hypothetical protein
MRHNRIDAILGVLFVGVFTSILVLSLLGIVAVSYQMVYG